MAALCCVLGVLIPSDSGTPHPMNSCGAPHEPRHNIVLLKPMEGAVGGCVHHDQGPGR